MDFCRRAQNALERGESARALMILVRGLRRRPHDEESLDLLLFVYTRHIDQPGLETEFIRGLEFHDHRPAMLRLAVDELRRVDNQEMARALEQTAGDRGVSIASPEVLEPESPDSEDRDPDEEPEVSLEDSGAVEVLTEAGLDAGSSSDDPAPSGREPAQSPESSRKERSEASSDRRREPSRETTDESSGASSRRRWVVAAVAVVVAAVVAVIVFVGWQHARDVRQMIAVDEAMVTLDPVDPAEVMETLDDESSFPGTDSGLQERERFVEAVVAVERGETPPSDGTDETPQTPWGLSAAALEAADRQQFEEAMRFVHHLEHGHADTLAAYFTRGRICEMRRDWECALSRYGRVQEHFEGFVPARMGAMRVSAYRYDSDRWRRQRSRLADVRPDHPYGQTPWIDVFDDQSQELGDGIWRREIGDEFLDIWRGLAGMVEARGGGDWAAIRDRCEGLGSEAVDRLAARALLCGKAVAEDGDVEAAHAYFESAAGQPGLARGLYREIQVRAPRILADLGRSDLGLSLAIPYDDTPLEPTGNDVESGPVEPGFEIPSHFRAPEEDAEPDDDQARALLVRGRVLIDHGATRRARRTLAPLTRRDDQGDRARFELTRSHLVEGNRESAMRTINQIGEDRLEAGARAYLAHLEGRHDEALGLGDRESDDPRLRRIQALAYLADGRGRDAMSILEESHRGLEKLLLRPVQLRAYARTGEHSALEGVRARLPDFDEARTVDVLIDVAGAAFWLRDLDSAGRWLERVLEQVPGQPEANWKAGLVRRAEGDDASSRLHFGRAWRGDENSPQWLVESGRVHLDAGRHEEARQAFLEAALRDREDVDAVRGLGQAYLEGNRRRGRRDLAELIDNYGGSAAEQPARAEMKRWLAILHGSREGDEQARPLLERAREIGGDRVPILVELGRYYGASGDWERARELFGNALRVDPTVPEVHLGLARSAEAVGDDERAGEHYRRLSELVPVGSPGDEARERLERLEENAE